METFDYQGKLYTMKDSLKFGEVRKINSNLSFVNEINEKYGSKPLEEIDPKELQLVMAKGVKIDDEMLSMITNILYRCLGLQQEELNNLDFVDALTLFYKVYQKSTVIKKNLVQPSASPTSSTI